MWVNETIRFSCLLHWRNYWNRLYIYTRHLQITLQFFWVSCKVWTEPNWSVYTLCYICACQSLTILGKDDGSDWEGEHWSSYSWLVNLQDLRLNDRVWICYLLRYVRDRTVDEMVMMVFRSKLCEVRTMDVMVVMVCWG